MDDFTIQRPVTMYGASKLFGESLGRYYMERYGLEFRCLRYPGILGPEFRTPSLAQAFSLMIEESYQGRPFVLKMAPDVRHALLYYKDAASAMIRLSGVPKPEIKTVCYLLKGIEPVLTARERVERVKDRIPEASLTFDPDPKLSESYYSLPTFDDRVACEEWGWEPEYDDERALNDFISELRQHPDRYI